MLKYSKAIAANTDLETSQAFISGPPQGFVQEETYLAFLVSGAGDNVFSSVRQSSADAIDNFFQSNEDLGSRLIQSFNSLKDALMGVEELEILGCAFKLSPKVGGNLSGVLYLVNLGGQKAYLKRQSNLITLAGMDNNSQIISGNMEPGDKILLLNRGMDQFINSGGRPGVGQLIDVPPDDLEDELEQGVMAQRNGPPLAAILIDNEIQALASPEALEEEVTTEPGQTPILNNPPITFPKVNINIPELVEKLKTRLPKGKRERLVLAGAAALVFLGIFLMVKRHGADAQKNLQFQNLLSDARSSLNNAEIQKDSDPDSAKKSLSDAEDALSQALKLEPDSPNAKDLQSQMDQEAHSILKVQTVASWPLFLDLNLIKNGFSASRLSESAGNILLLDTNQKTLVEINLAKKANNILAGAPQFGQAEAFSINGANAFVYSKDKGITEINTNTLKAQTVAKPDPDWGNIIDIQGFAGNFYLLDSLKNQIWKYVPVGSSFSDKNTYLNSGVVANFSDAQRFLIDSSIWVLRSNSEIDRFTAGSPDSFNVGGLDKNIQNISAFFISSDTDNIYILDSFNSRIVVLKKSGQYVSQLQGDKFKDASDFVVDEQGKKLYLLENNKIYVIDLQ